MTYDPTQYPPTYQAICNQVANGCRNRLRYGIPDDPISIGYRRTGDPTAMARMAVMCGEIKNCTACPLATERGTRYTKCVPGAGAIPAQVMIVGEAPGYYEETVRDPRAGDFGLPFVGPAGKLLDRILESIGLTRNEVFITNVLKCRPENNRDPLPLEVEACRPFLHEQIALVKPWVIIAMGRFAAIECLELPKRTALGDTLGILHSYPPNPIIKVWPMKHPAFLLRQVGHMVGYHQEMQIIGAALIRARKNLAALQPKESL